MIRIRQIPSLDSAPGKGVVCWLPVDFGEGRGGASILRVGGRGRVGGGGGLGGPIWLARGVGGTQNIQQQRLVGKGKGVKKIETAANIDFYDRSENTFEAMFFQLVYLRSV